MAMRAPVGGRGRFTETSMRAGACNRASPEAEQEPLTARLLKCEDATRQARAGEESGVEMEEQKAPTVMLCHTHVMPRDGSPPLHF